MLGQAVVRDQRYIMARFFPGHHRSTAFSRSTINCRWASDTARAKAADAVKLFREGQRVSDVAKALGIGRASVYRALADAGVVHL